MSICHHPIVSGLEVCRIVQPLNFRQILDAALARQGYLLGLLQDSFLRRVPRLADQGMVVSDSVLCYHLLSQLANTIRGMFTAVKLFSTR